MKRIVFWMVALLLMSGVAMAQGNRQGGRQQMDPKTRAERMTERMVKEYSLNEDQKQQLQDVNLTWVQKMAANQGGRSKDNKAERAITAAMSSGTRKRTVGSSASNLALMCV